jgi:hypothetical protein
MLPPLRNGLFSMPPSAHPGAGIRQPVAYVDFCANSNAKIPIIRPAANFRFGGICRVKNRLIGFFGGV